MKQQRRPLEYVELADEDGMSLVHRAKLGALVLVIETVREEARIRDGRPVPKM